MEHICFLKYNFDFLQFTYSYLSVLNESLFLYVKLYEGDKYMRMEIKLGAMW